jgi:hypothetical protein
MRALAFLPMASGGVFIVAGCGLDQGGLEQAPPSNSGNLGSADGAAGTEVMADAATRDSTDTVSPLSSDDASPSGDDASCSGGANTCAAVPSGWTLVAFAGTRSSACPAGFTRQSTDIVQAPPSGTAQCSCGTCTVTSPPTCDSGSIPVHYDNVPGAGAGTCSLVAQPGTGPLVNNPPGSCGTDLYQGSYSAFDISYESPAAAGGACTAKAAPAGPLTTTAERVCAADGSQSSTCNGHGCPLSIAAPFKVCIMAMASMSCPTGPLSVRNEVGTSGSLSCADCSCSVTANCSGTVTLYTDAACTKGPYAVPADGSCNPVNKQKASYSSYVYSGGSPTNVSCTASAGAGPPSVDLVNQATICCAP